MDFQQEMPGVPLLEIDSEVWGERLQELFRYAKVGRCANGVTHDIDNMLGAIMAYAELVGLGESLSDEEQRMLGEIVEATSKSSKLLNNLTSIARDRKDVVGMVSVGVVVMRALALQDYVLRVDNIELASEIPENIPEIIGDAPAIQLAVIYLLMNAHDALVGQKDKRVRVGVVGTPDGILVEVWNSGEPISADMVETIFEGYYTEKGEHHIGLGLSAARDVATRHDGDLKYDADRGFQLYLKRDNSLKGLL